MQKVEINENILNNNFSDYFNDNFIKINLETSYDYGISYHYNYYYPPKSALAFRFMEKTVLKSAFAVEDESSINQVILYLEIYDIDLFYRELVEKYGLPETKSVSKFYLEQHGFKVPTERDKLNQNSYDSLPEPQIVDFKNLRNVSWYEIQSEDKKVETNMIVKNHLDSSIVGTEAHTVEVIFIRAKK